MWLFQWFPKIVIKEQPHNPGHSVVPMCFAQLHKNFRTSCPNRFTQNHWFLMDLPLELKFAIIEAYYENGRSPTLVRRSLFFRGSKWCSVVPNLTNEQIKRFVNQLRTNHTLKNNSPPGRSRSVITEKSLARIWRKLELSPRRSVRRP